MAAWFAHRDWVVGQTSPGQGRNSPLVGGIFDGGELGDDLGFRVPVGGFKSGAVLGLQEQMADISERGGAARRDAVGGEGFKEFAEDVVDIDLGDEITGGTGKLFEEIVFAMLGAAVGGAVIAAESLVVWMRRHGTAFAVGELKSAKSVEWVRSLVAHRRIINEEVRY